MKIYYVGKKGPESVAALKNEDTYIALHYDNWDDYTFKTYFPTSCFVKGKSYELGIIRILFEEKTTSWLYLDARVKDGWDRSFPIPDIKYISVPGELEFYSLLISAVGIDEALEVAKQLHDASVFTRILDDEGALTLIKTKAFSASLQRETGSKRAFLDGWKVFRNESVAISDFSFVTKLRDSVFTTQFKFSHEILPSNINVIIGPNGVGKSQTLLQLIKKSLTQDPEKKPSNQLDDNINFSQIICSSFSPFDDFPVDTKDVSENLSGDVYKYFGFRKRNEDGVVIENDVFKPRRDSSFSVIAMLIDDHRFSAMEDWSLKVRTAIKLLRGGIPFDKLALRVKGAPYFESLSKVRPDLCRQSTKGRNYVVIDEGEEYELELLKANIFQGSGVSFFKGDRILELSSGQRLFTYLVTSILGAIKRNSLVLLDEPELFLHPNLEVELIGMLNALLSAYASKAIIATHSLSIVREVPARCVHVLSRGEDGVTSTIPPFETLGGDIQRISSYVFGDKSVTKPFEAWLKISLEKFGSGDALIEKLGDDINEELIIQIRAMERGQWL